MVPNCVSHVHYIIRFLLDLDSFNSREQNPIILRASGPLGICFMYLKYTYA